MHRWNFAHSKVLFATLAQLIPLACLVYAMPAMAGQFSLLFTGDSHSHLDSSGTKDLDGRGTLGGLTRAASIVAQVEQTDPNVVFVHAGDLFNGDLYFPATIGPGGTPALSVPEMQILGDLGLDVLTLGNHELGLGTDALAATLWAAYGGAGPSVITANIDLEAAGLDGLVTPRVVKEVDGVKVGFFGLTVVDYLSMGAPFLPESYSPEGLITLAASEAATLRADPYDADVVVCVAHLGLPLEEAIAGNAPGIDVVIGAHDHVALSEPEWVPGPEGHAVPVVKAGQFYQHLGYLHVSYDGGVVSFPGYQLFDVDASVPRLPPVDAVVQGLQQAISAHYDEDFWGEPIGYAVADVTKDVRPPLRDTGVGDLVTDALRAAGGTDIAVNAEGFFTEQLYKGVLAGDDVFRIVGNGIDPAGGPGFALYTAKITGEKLMLALETSVGMMSASTGLTTDDFFLQVSGMRFMFDTSLPEPPRVLGAWVGGRPLDPSAVYTVTLDEGNLQGLALFPDVEFVEPPVRIEGTDEYRALRDFIASKRVLHYAPSGRSIDLGSVPRAPWHRVYPHASEELGRGPASGQAAAGMARPLLFPEGPRDAVKSQAIIFRR